MASHDGVAGKRVLITGATSGLGFAMARALVGRGARVFLTGRSPGKVTDAVAGLSPGSAGGECRGAVMDVRSEESVHAGVASMIEHWNGIDVLVNNAGVGMRTVNPRFLTDPRPFWEVTAAGFRDLVDTNLTGYFLVAREVVPHFLRQQSGRIVNVGVSLGTMGRKGYIPYGPSRAATDSLSRIMAQDLMGSGVTVNLLLPGGATETGMVPDDLPVARRAGLLPPDVMAEPILFLCSDDGREVNDQRIDARDFDQWKGHWEGSRRAARETTT